MSQARAAARAAARERILRAAHQVFAANGFRGASLDMIAREVGITRAGVLHHFGSKEAVLLALLEARDVDLGLDGQDPGPASGTASQVLSQARSLVGRVLADRDLVLLAHALSAEAADPAHPAHDWLAARYRRMRSSIAAAARASLAAGEVAPDVDPDLLAALVLGAIEGLENQWLVTPDDVDVPAALALLERLLTPPT